MDAPPRRGEPDEYTPCADDIAVNDVAALRAGTLAPDGIERLARHLAGCEACRLLIAALVADSQRAEWTGNHQASPPREARKP